MPKVLQGGKKRVYRPPPPTLKKIFLGFIFKFQGMKKFSKNEKDIKKIENILKSSYLKNNRWHH
jgi:hypothetical protein